MLRKYTNNTPDSILLDVCVKFAYTKLRTLLHGYLYFTIVDVYGAV